MELGLNFDDGDFVEEQKEKPVLISYNAKICESKWFQKDLTPDGGDGLATVYKFQADHHYSTGEYARSIECFKQCLESLGVQNRSMRREIVESLARCYIRTGDWTKALEYSDKMVAECLTPAHYCQALLLQRQIHRHMGQIHEEIRVLHQLIQLHSFHCPFWSMLAHAYSKLYLKTQTVSKPDNMGTNMDSIENEIDGNTDAKTEDETGTANCHKKMSDCGTGYAGHEINFQGNKVSRLSDETGKLELEEIKNAVEEVEDADRKKKTVSDHIDAVNKDNIGKDEETDYKPLSKTSRETDGMRQDNPNSCNIFSEYPCDLMMLTCLVRIKLILQSNLRSTGSFVKERNMKKLKQTEQDIQTIKPDNHVLETVTEFMRSDMFDDDYEEDTSKDDAGIQNGATTPVLAEDFHKRWFSWIKQLG